MALRGMKVAVFIDGTIELSEDFKRRFPNAEVSIEDGRIVIKNLYDPSNIDANGTDLSIAASLVAKNVYTDYWNRAHADMPKSWFVFKNTLQYDWWRRYDSIDCGSPYFNVNKGDEFYVACVHTSSVAYTHYGDVQVDLIESTYDDGVGIGYNLYHVKANSDGSVGFDTLENIYGVRFMCCRNYNDEESAREWLHKERAELKYFAKPEDGLPTLSQVKGSLGEFSSVELNTPWQCDEFIEALNIDGSFWLDKPVRINYPFKSYEATDKALDVFSKHVRTSIDYGLFTVYRREDGAVVAEQKDFTNEEDAFHLMLKFLALRTEIDVFKTENITIDIPNNVLDAEWADFDVLSYIEKYFYGKGNSATILEVQHDDGTKDEYVVSREGSDFVVIGHPRPIKFKKLDLRGIEYRYIDAFETVEDANFNGNGEVLDAFTLPNVTHIKTDFNELAGGKVSGSYNNSKRAMKFFTEHFDYETESFIFSAGIGRLSLKNSAYDDKVWWLAKQSSTVSRVFIPSGIFREFYDKIVDGASDIGKPIDTDYLSLLASVLPTLSRMKLPGGSYIDVHNGCIVPLINSGHAVDVIPMIEALLAYDTGYNDNIERYMRYSFNDPTYEPPIKMPVRQGDKDYINRLLRLANTLYDVFKKRSEANVDIEKRSPDAQKMVEYVISNVRQYAGKGADFYIYTPKDEPLEKFLSGELHYSTSRPDDDSVWYIVKVDKYCNVGVIKNEQVDIEHEFNVDKLGITAVAKKTYDKITLVSQQNSNGYRFIGSSQSGDDVIVLEYEEDTQTGLRKIFVYLNMVTFGFTYDFEYIQQESITPSDTYKPDDDSPRIEYEIVKNDDGTIDILYRVLDKNGNDITDVYKTLTVEDFFFHKEL